MSCALFGQMQFVDILHCKFLSTNSPLDKLEYTKQKAVVQKLIRQVKNNAEIDVTVEKSDSPWKCMRQFQKSFEGLRPSVSRSIRNENEDLC